MHDFLYNGKSLSSLGFAIKTKPLFHVAERDFEMVSVSGRDGDVIVDNGGYKNVDEPYQVNSIPYRVHSNSQRLAQSFIDWLAPFDGSYKELRDTYHEGYFTKAICKNIDEIAELIYKGLDTTIHFSRAPFWYSDFGQNKITTTEQTLSLNNPESFNSLPYIKIIGSGAMTVYTGAATLSIRSSFSGYIEIDSESMKIFQGNTNCSGLVSATHLPYFTPGSNAIRVVLSSSDSRFEGMEVIPRWRRL